MTKSDYIRKYRRTKKGLSIRIFSNQKNHSRTRNNSIPTYSIVELREWLFSHKDFDLLYDKWVISGYEYTKTPSVDRIDDNKGYSLDNIQLMTWEENRKKSYKDKINGINNKINKKVYQLDKQDNFVNEFYSLMDAFRKTGVNFRNISSVCKGRRITAGGYKWKLA